jgi:hypothetical protein
MFHVHYKPLWAAVGEPDSRFRKPAALGRMIERVMILAAVLEGRDFAWLATAIDKRRHFMRYLGDRLEKTDYPQLTFGDGEAKVVRHFLTRCRLASSRILILTLSLLGYQPLADGCPAVPVASWH